MTDLRPLRSLPANAAFPESGRWADEAWHEQYERLSVNTRMCERFSERNGGGEQVNRENGRKRSASLEQKKTI